MKIKQDLVKKKVNLLLKIINEKNKELTLEFNNGEFISYLSTVVFVLHANNVEMLCKSDNYSVAIDANQTLFEIGNEVIKSHKIHN
jgi:hypothetical protein